MPKEFIEFFAGIGLISAALAPLGWKPALANDIDEKKLKTYRCNWPNIPISSVDIRELDSATLPVARLVTASFPCIDVSQAGNRFGIDGRHSSTVWSFLDHIEKMSCLGRKPSFLMIENVPGLLWADGGRAIDILLRRIAQLDYYFDLIQVDARHFLPQARNRVFIVATTDPLRHRTTTTAIESPIRRYRVADVYARNRHLPWCFFDFPPLPHRQVELVDVIEDVPPDNTLWWSTERLEYFLSLLELSHRPRLDHLRATGGYHVLTAVRRLRRRRLREQIFNLRFDGLASCVRTPRGGSSTQYVVAVAGGQFRVRRLLGIEAARLQGAVAPGDGGPFKVVGTETDQLFAFGDAVCVPVVEWVARNSIETAASRPQRDVQLSLI